MEISTRNCGQYSNVPWTEITVKHDGTKINFDVIGEEKQSFAEYLADTAFDLMPDLQTIVNYLKGRGYLDDIVDYTRTEDEDE